MSAFGRSPAGGKLNHELTLVDFEQFFQVNCEPVSKGSFIVWKTLLVLSILLLSVVALPLAGAQDINLTQENLLSIINQDRQFFGLYPLKESIKLEQAARAKAEDILRGNYFAHTSPTGVTPWEFIRTANFNYALAGENLAINYTSSYEVQRDLLASTSHRENLLSQVFSDIGIAVVSGEYLGEPAVITVQMFGTPVE